VPKGLPRTLICRVGLVLARSQSQSFPFPRSRSLQCKRRVPRAPLSLILSSSIVVFLTTWQVNSAPTPLPVTNSTHIVDVLTSPTQSEAPRHPPCPRDSSATYIFSSFQQCLSFQRSHRQWSHLNLAECQLGSLSRMILLYFPHYSFLSHRVQQIH
jgi:hypothetical protein